MGGRRAIAPAALWLCLLLTRSRLRCQNLNMPEDLRAKKLYRSFGDLVATLRRDEARSWTQEELATRTSGSLTRSAIANIESGRQRVSLFQLYELARALEVQPQELLPPKGLSLKPDTEVNDQAFVARIKSQAQKPAVLDEQED